MGVDWEPEAARLAAEVTEPVSRWRGPVSATPRHLFVPRWWRYLDPDGWTLREGPADEPRWMRAAYSDRSLVTRVGARHADQASPGDHPAGRPTSSSTMPGLVVRMYQHASSATVPMSWTSAPGPVTAARCWPAGWVSGM